MNIDRIQKSATVSGGEATPEALDKINQYSLRKLAAEDVFVFRVTMCGNEVDRDYEHFSRSALDEMAKLFVGKTIISDHRWSASGQIARIYDTEIVETTDTTKTGERYAKLVAECYTVRTEETKSFIDAVDGGILREVSVGCAVKTCTCSICGANMRKTWCDHYPGRDYDGKSCTIELSGVYDAYELSFVAVPAQPDAGVTKSYGAEKPDKPTNPDEEPEKQKNMDADARLRLADAFLFIQNQNN